MTELKWDENSNLEQSLYFFLNSEITDNSITIRDNEGNLVSPVIRIARKFDSEWELPTIAIKNASLTAPQFLIGTTRVDRTYLVTLDIFAENDTQRNNLAGWLRGIIETGFDYYEWIPNGTTPSKTIAGRVNIEFVTDAEIFLGDDIAEIDKYRWRISINCQVCLN